ncbi:MAG: M1 family metallopeptidase [Chitinophagales bacterium]|nr:M1 family metallopeptidase [Chitinophagales bacterium]
MKFYSNISLCACLLIAFMVSSCSSKKVIKQKVTLNEISVSAKNNPYSIYRATTSKEWEIIHTHVSLNFDWKGKTADGEARLQLMPYFYATDSLVLDAKSMRIDAVEWNSGSWNSIASHNYTNDKLTLRFRKPVTRDSQIHIYIKYKAMPYATAGGGSKAINDDRGLYFINTDYAIEGKPAQIWTQGETESNSHWVPTIDKPNQRTATRIELTVPDSFTTLSNGVLLKQEPLAGGMRKDIWSMHSPIQVYAMTFAIGKYEVIKDRETKSGREVSYYVEPKFAPYAKDIFRNTPDMIDYFSQVTGVAYPWNKYSQVVVRDYISGAMENTSASTFGEFMNKNHREIADADNDDIVAHELFHQWFGDYVTAESWSNLTLNESFATYGEQLWRRYRYGKASVDKTIRDDLNAYLGSNSTEPLVRFHYRDKEDMFDRVSYQKGSVILHYLHQLIGDEAFSRAMMIYLTRNALKPAEATQWRLAVEEATGKDWNWFFNQWYYRGGHPQLDIKYTYDDEQKQLKVELTQKQKEGVFILPFKTDIVYGSERITEDWLIETKSKVFTYPYKNGVKPMIIPDVYHWVVGTIDENKTSGEWLNTYKASGDDIVSRLKSIEQIGKDIDDTNNQEIINAALKDKDAYVREVVVSLLAPITNTKLQDKWKTDVRYIATNDPNNQTRARAIYTLGYWKDNNSKNLMLESVSDSSYAVAGASLSALNRMDKDTAYSLAKKYYYTQPAGELENIIWEVIGERGKDDDIKLFEEKANYYYGRDRISFANALSMYIDRVRNDDAFERGMGLFTVVVKDEAIKSYRQSEGLYLIMVANAYKQQLKDNTTNAIDRERATVRLQRLKKAIELMQKEEKDEEIRNVYETYTNRIFN